MKMIFSFALLVLVTFSAQAQSKEDRVWRRVQDLTKAVFETRDSIVIKDLVSSRVSYGHSSGVVENKAEMLHNAVTTPVIYKMIEIEKVSIDVSDDFALVRHNLRGVSVDAKGAESPLNLAILQVWKKEAGKWRIWGRQAVKIAPKS
jgi:hypothetical protein